MSSLLLVGNDKVGRKLLDRLGRNPKVIIALDDSLNVQRVIKLIFRGKLSLRQLSKMAWAELRRSAYPRIIAPSIRSNEMLLTLIRQSGVKKVYLFRAGLVINELVLKGDVEILNVHCAKLPEYGGLCSLDRALRDGAFEQCACLHRVTLEIDTGEVLQTHSYELDSKLSYADNESRAYDAGIELLISVLNESSDSDGTTCVDCDLLN